jgi:hypothetical protein
MRKTYVLLPLCATVVVVVVAAKPLEERSRI